MFKKSNRMKPFILAAILFCPLCLAEETVIVAAGDYPPILGKTLPQQGYASHILHLALASQGIKVELKFLPWKRVEIMTARGDYVATIAWFCTDIRKQDFDCGDALLEES